MRLRDNLSVVFIDAESAECEEYYAPNGDTGTETAIRTLVVMDTDEEIGIILKLEPHFDFGDAHGVKVTLAIGNGPPSPNNVQNFWVSKAKRDKTTKWTKLSTWSDERAQKNERRLRAPAPADGSFNFEHVSVEKWEKAKNAPAGSIAVYITRGRLPGETLPGLKRCVTDPPESAKPDGNFHPIRAEWFEPSPGEAGKTYVFMASNISEETFNAMGLDSVAPKSGHQDEGIAAEPGALSGSQIEAGNAREIGRKGKRYRLRSRTSGLLRNQQLSVTGPVRSPEPAPASYAKDRKRGASSPNASRSPNDKRTKTETAESEAEWIDYNGEGNLFMREGAASKDDMTTSKPSAQTPGKTSSPSRQGGQGVLQNSEAIAARQAARKIQDLEAGIKIRHQRTEFERRFGRSLEEYPLE